MLLADATILYRVENIGCLFDNVTVNGENMTQTHFIDVKQIANNTFYTYGNYTPASYTIDSMIIEEVNLVANSLYSDMMTSKIEWKTADKKQEPNVTPDMPGWKIAVDPQRIRTFMIKMDSVKV